MSRSAERRRRLRRSAGAGGRGELPAAPLCRAQQEGGREQEGAGGASGKGAPRGRAQKKKKKRKERKRASGRASERGERAGERARENSVRKILGPALEFLRIRICSASSLLTTLVSSGCLLSSALVQYHLLLIQKDCTNRSLDARWTET